MEVTKIKKTDNKKKISNKKIKVAAYVRVSTDSDNQLNSFKSQKKYYRTKINQNPKWKFVGIYADEGISGTSSKKRVAFNEMIRDALIGKIDLILTKSISRFARNTVDTLKYVRLLKENNVDLHFEEENINILDKTGEFLLTILSSVAQQESINISNHVRKGHEMLLKNGNLIVGKRCYGYKIDFQKRKIEIIPEEAEVIKLVFEMFLEGNTYIEIARFLNDKGIKTFYKNTKWLPQTIRRFLTNEKYTGDLLQKKNVSVTPLANSVKNNGVADKYLIRNFHEPIISREDFDKAQELIKEKYIPHKVSKQNVLSYRIKCGFCGSSSNNSYWNNLGQVSTCRNRFRNGKTSCPNSRNINLCKIIEAISKSLNTAKNIILKSKNENLLYIKNLIKKNIEIDKYESFGKVIKYVIIGGYDSFNRVSPCLIRVVLFNNYPLSDYDLKKIPKKKIIGLKTDMINSEWISKKIVSYDYIETQLKKNIVSKIKVCVEVESN